jgi:predicted AlkP superfamily pyrophosphatase or phosphodiesterase
MKKRLACVLVAVLVAACTPDSADAPRDDKERDASSTNPDCSGVPTLVERVRRGWYPGRSPQLSFVVSRPHYVGRPEMPAHTGPWDFLVDVPLVLYGPGVIARRGSIDRPAGLVDLAPTTARLIGYEGWRRRSGRVLNEALTPASSSPRLVVTIVWDGAGDNALEAHKRAWPFLRSLEDKGTSFARATVGSTPSNTPPIHATIGTGAFPREHGVVSINQSSEPGRYVDPWADNEPAALEVPTLGDLYDKDAGNVPEVGVVATVNWHLGMIGHGSELAGGDRDLAALFDSSGNTYGNSADYEVPSISETALLADFRGSLDRSDGAIDDKWHEHDLSDPALLNSSPAFVGFQQQMIERIIAEHDFGRDRTPDLLYVNIKQSDVAGHRWGIYSDEVGAVLEAQDDALRSLVRFLDSRVGRRRWALAVTADHGMMPYPRDSGGWAIAGAELKKDINAEFDTSANGIDLIDRVSAHGADVNASELHGSGITLDEIAEWLTRYRLAHNAGDRSIPRYLRGRERELLFDAIVIHGRKAVIDC